MWGLQNLDMIQGLGLTAYEGSVCGFGQISNSKLTQANQGTDPFSVQRFDKKHFKAKDPTLGTKIMYEEFQNCFSPKVEYKKLRHLQRASKEPPAAPAGSLFCRQ